jgi:hypothetical protein
MSSIVKEAIAAELAKLTREVPAPTEPLGYGRDLSCTDDVTDDLAEVDEFSYQGIGEAVVRRLTCPRGQLPDDPDYGLDIRSYCNRGVTANELRLLEPQISLELDKDDRIASSTVAVTTSDAGRTLGLTIEIVPADPDLVVFTLTLAVTDRTVILEALNLAA